MSDPKIHIKYNFTPVNPSLISVKMVNKEVLFIFIREIFAIIVSKVQQVVAGGISHERKVRAACEAGLHLTDGQSDLRASATESR